MFPLQLSVVNVSKDVVPGKTSVVSCWVTWTDQLAITFPEVPTAIITGTQDMV